MIETRPMSDTVTAVDYGSTTVTEQYPHGIDATGTGEGFYVSVSPVPRAEMHLTCRCRAELKLTNYAVPDALDYAKEWWKAHKDC